MARERAVRTVRGSGRRGTPAGAGFHRPGRHRPLDRARATLEAIDRQKVRGANRRRPSSGAAGDACLAYDWPAMNRRRFLEAAAGALAVGATQSAFAGQTPPPAPAAAPAGPPPPRPAWSKKNAFKLKYAPHIGMFANS